MDQSAEPRDAPAGRADVWQLVRDAIIWAKADVVTLRPEQLAPSTVLGEPPVDIDSLEFLKVIIRLEELVGLVADDTQFSSRSIRTVQDLAAEVERWIDDPGTRVVPGSALR